MYDLILTKSKVIDVRSNHIYEGDILIRDRVIVGIEPHQDRKAKNIIDVSEKYVAPGFIDSHLHIESSMLNPIEFSREAVKHGTTTILVDPHEIANVFGRKAVELFLKLSDLVPLDMLVGIPSCVPATSLENSGASITVEDIREMIPDERIYDLGDAREKSDLAFNAGKIVDGHCPGVTGEDLKKYISNGKNDNTVRIMSDHESTGLDEVIEKNKMGMYIALRYGSASKDLERILPGLIKEEYNLEKFMLCSDDLDSDELYEKGHVDRIISKARNIIQENSVFSLEKATITAISLATINPASYLSRFLKLHNYPEVGEISVNKKANLVVFDSLENLEIDKVIYNGELIVNNQEYVGKPLDYDYSEFIGKVNVGRTFEPDDFKIEVKSAQTNLDVKVIEIIEGNIVTKLSILPFAVFDKELRADPERDIAKIAVIERHQATGSYSVGFVKGLGIKQGAVASTIAHDSHNLIVAGAGDEDMAKAVNLLAKEGGGMVVVTDRIDYFPLKIGGLMSTESIENVVKGYKALKNSLKKTGSGLENTLMTLSFLALPVIPELRITDKGLVDVNKFEIVNLF
jgi:adenine deaminase